MATAPIIGNGPSHRDRDARRSYIKVDKFDGTKPLDIFLEKFEDAAVYNGWSDEDKRLQLKSVLDGDADQAFQVVRQR